MQRPPRFMEYGLFAKAVDEISEKAIAPTILLHSMAGEPTLHPNILEMISYAKERGRTVYLLTNGSRLEPEFVEKLIDSGVDRIKISVHTPTAETFRLRAADTEFEPYRELVTSAIAQILDREFQGKVSFTLLKTPYKRFSKMFRRWPIMETKEEIYQHTLSWLQAIEEKMENASARSAIADWMKGLSGWIAGTSLIRFSRFRIAKNFTLDVPVMLELVTDGLKADEQSLKRARFGYCAGLTKHITVLSDGRMVFCPSDIDGATAFGNLEDTSILEAYGREDVVQIGKSFRQYRFDHSHCQKCRGAKTIPGLLYRGVYSIVKRCPIRYED